MKKLLSLCAVAWGLCFSGTGFAQPVTFGTAAGYDGRSSIDGTGQFARFYRPQAVAVDRKGNIYVADTRNHLVRKITRTGTVSTVAGTVGVSGMDDGEARQARFNSPQGIAVDGGGNVYVADSGSHTIRKIAPWGSVSTIAGLAGQTGASDGVGSRARFFQPLGLAVDRSGNVYVADFGNSTIRKVTPGAVVSTMAGTPGVFGSNDGTGANALFCQPQGVAVDGSYNVYVADFGNSMIRKVTSDGVVTTLAGLAGSYGSADGVGSNARFYYPTALAVGSEGSLYVSDSFNHIIRRISPSGAVSRMAGTAGLCGSTDGSGIEAQFRTPAGIAVDSNDCLVVADTGNGTIRYVAADGMVSTLAGSASEGPVDGIQRDARFSSPAGLAVTSNGEVYVADTSNGTIRKINAIGVSTTLAGSAGNLGSFDGSGVEARFFGPEGVAVDGSGWLYVADTGNSTVRKVSPDGSTSTLAGQAGVVGAIDGIGAEALFNHPRGVVVDETGEVFVADTWNHLVRRITTGGSVSTIAGAPEFFGSADGANSGARFNYPVGIAADGAGSLIVSDSFNHTLRKITKGGTNWVVTTLAGLAGVSGDADGTNTAARFFQPTGVAVANGAIYVVDSGNHTIRKLVRAGTNWVVSTIAGQAGVSGGGARFFCPAAIAVDGDGMLYVADRGNNTVRVERIPPPLLEASALGNGMILTWPASASQTGFVLESTGQLSAGGGWSPVLEGWDVTGDCCVLRVNAGLRSFYRLRQP